MSIQRTHTEGLNPVRLVLGFVLGLVVILTAVISIQTARRVSALEDRTGLIEDRLDVMRMQQELVEERLGLIEATAHPPAGR